MEHHRDDGGVVWDGSVVGVAVFGFLFVAPFVDMAWWQVKSFVDFSIHFFSDKA